MLMLVTARVSGIFLVGPVFSSAAIPIRLRLLMSLVLAQALAVTVVPVAIPAGVTALAIAVGCELAIGATIGFAVRLIFTGVELGAFHVAQQMGLSLAESFQAQGQEAGGILRRFMYLLVVVIFLCIGGHREMIRALRMTFRAIPLTGFPDGDQMLNMVVALLGVSFTLALKVAVPALIALLLATVALGMLQRTMPQYNTLTVGLPGRIMIGLLVLAGSLAILDELVARAITLTFGQVFGWLAMTG